MTLITQSKVETGTHYMWVTREGRVVIEQLVFQYARGEATLPVGSVTERTLTTDGAEITESLVPVGGTIELTEIWWAEPDRSGVVGTYRFTGDGFTAC